MNFREEYGDFHIQETVDAIVALLKRKGASIDDRSFTWTLVGALFRNGIIKREEFESTYYSLVQQRK